MNKMRKTNFKTRPGPSEHPRAPPSNSRRITLGRSPRDCPRAEKANACTEGERERIQMKRISLGGSRGSQKCADNDLRRVWEAGGWDRGHASAGRVGQDWGGVGASTWWLRVGTPCGGCKRSAKGKEGLAGGWVRVEWWLVCGVAAWAGKVYHTKWRSRRVDRTEKRSTTHRRLNSRSARA